MIKQLKSKLLTQSLVTQSLMDLLIEKKIFTRKEILDKIDFNMELWEDLVEENKNLIDDTSELLEKIPKEKEVSEELFSGLYYGPIGEC
jgi:hypothetical protein|tara:strand:+ start:634 stop:900 length:267 start_codon:yes stop_codon:yes gene_type:complete